MLDPSCPDITGRVLEALCRRGFKLSDPAIEKGVGFLLETQERDGSWYGRWGVNYLYGTFLALRGLRAAQDPGLEGGVEGREVDRLRCRTRTGAGRELRELQRGPLRARAEHSVADRVGAARPDRGRPG